MKFRLLIEAILRIFRDRLFYFFLAVTVSNCTLFSTRPIQEMSDASAALKAALEVQADTLAPELFRQAREWFFKAKQEYQLKNFAEARDYAEKSRRFAEKSEFEAIRNGAARSTVPSDPISADEMQKAPPSAPVHTKKDENYAPPDRKEFYDDTQPPKPATTETPLVPAAPFKSQ